MSGSDGESSARSEGEGAADNKHRRKVRRTAASSEDGSGSGDDNLSVAQDGQSKDKKGKGKANVSKKAKGKDKAKKSKRKTEKHSSEGRCESDDDGQAEGPKTPVTIKKKSKKGVEEGNVRGSGSSSKGGGGEDGEDGDGEDGKNKDEKKCGYPFRGLGLHMRGAELTGQDPASVTTEKIPLVASDLINASVAIGNLVRPSLERSSYSLIDKTEFYQAENVQKAPACAMSAIWASDSREYVGWLAKAEKQRDFAMNVHCVLPDAAQADPVGEVLRVLHAVHGLNALSAHQTSYVNESWLGNQGTTEKQSMLGTLGSGALSALAIDLFVIRLSSPTEFDPNLMKFATILAECSNDIESKPMSIGQTTHFTTVGAQRSNRQWQCRAGPISLTCAGNSDAGSSFRHTGLAASLNQHLLQKVVQHRYRQDPDFIKHRERIIHQNNMSYKANTRQCFQEDMEADVIENKHNGIRIQIGTTVLDARDDMLCHAPISVDTVRILPTAPGVDPTQFIFDLLSKHEEAMTLLHNICIVMAGHLKITEQITINSLFETRGFNLPTLALAENMRLAVARFAEKKSMFLENEDGIEIKIHDAGFMEEFGKLIGFRTDERRCHYRKMLECTSKVMMNAAHFKRLNDKSILHMRESFLVGPMLWVIVPVDVVRRELTTELTVLKHHDLVSIDDVGDTVETEITKMLSVANSSSTLFSTSEQTHIFRQTGEDYMWKYGAFYEVRLSAINKKSTVDMLPMPGDISAMMQTYLLARWDASETDFYRRFFTTTNLIPDQESMLHNKALLSPPALRMLDSLSQSISSIQDMIDMQTKAREALIFEIMGAKRSKILEEIEHVYQDGDVKEMMRRVCGLIVDGCNRSVSASKRSPCTLFQETAKVLLNMQKESKDDKSVLWHQFMSLYLTDKNEKTLDPVLLDTDGMLFNMTMASQSCYDYDLHLGNIVLLRRLWLGNVAQAMNAIGNTEKEFMIPSIICDAGGSHERKNIFTGKLTMFAEKTTGAGHGRTDSTRNRMINALREQLGFRAPQDETVLRMTEKTLREKNGSVLSMWLCPKTGKMVMSANNDVQSYGRIITLSEGGKAESIETTKNTLANIEMSLQDSETDMSGSTRDNATNQITRTIEVMYCLQSLSLGSMCSNLHMPLEKSMMSRVSLVPCSTMDDLGENTFQTTISQQGGASLKKKVMMDHGANDPKSQKPANEVSDQAKHDHFFYWLLFWFGRYANMETKWFTKSLVTTSNSMRAGHHLPLALAMLTVNVRRFQFNSDDTGGTESFSYAMRLLNGSFRSVYVKGHFALCLIARAFELQVRLAKRSSKGTIFFDMYKSFTDFMKMKFLVPISITSQISGVYDLLRTEMLDIKLMMFTCYTATLFGMKQSCDWMNIAMAIKAPHLMTAVQQARYEYMCRFLFDMVFELVGEDAQHRCEFRSGNQITNNAKFKSKSINTYADMCNWDLAANYNHESDMEKMVQSNNTGVSSVYAQMGPVQFQTEIVPDDIKVIIDKTNGKSVPGRPTNRVTPFSEETWLWKQFALAQDSEQDQARQSSQNLPTYQKNLSPLWESMMASCNFTPREGYYKTYLTNEFYKSIVDSTGSLVGPMTDFLQLCGFGVHEKPSRRDFFVKFYRHFLNFVMLDFELKCTKQDLENNGMKALITTAIENVTVDLLSARKYDGPTVKVKVSFATKFNFPDTIKAKVHIIVGRDHVDVVSDLFSDLCASQGLVMAYQTGFNHKNLCTIDKIFLRRIPNNIMWKAPIADDVKNHSKIWRVFAEPTKGTPERNKSVYNRLEIGLVVDTFKFFCVLAPLFTLHKDHGDAGFRTTCSMKNIANASVQMTSLIVMTQMDYAECPVLSCKDSSKFLPLTQNGFEVNHGDTYLRIPLKVPEMHPLTFIDGLTNTYTPLSNSYRSNRFVWDDDGYLEYGIRASTGHREKFGYQLPLNPESRLHMSIYEILKPAYANVKKQKLYPENYVLVNTLKQLGSNIKRDDVSVLPFKMLEWMVDVEICCSTYENHLFVVQMNRERTAFTFKNTNVSHTVDNDYKALALPDNITVSVRDMWLCMSHGIITDSNGNMRMNDFKWNDVLPELADDERYLPWFTMPIINWTTLTRWVVVDDMFVSLKDTHTDTEAQYCIMTTERVFRKMSMSFMPKKAVRSFLANHMPPQTFSKLQNMNIDVSSIMICEDHEQCVIVNMWIVKDNQPTHYFLHTEEFVWAVQNDNLDEFAVHTDGYMVTMDDYYLAKETGSGQVFSLTPSPDHTQLTATLAVYDNNDFQKSKSELQAVKAAKEECEDEDARSELVQKGRVLYQQMSNAKVTRKISTRLVCPRAFSYTAVVVPPNTFPNNHTYRTVWGKVVPHQPQDGTNVRRWTQKGMHLVEFMQTNTTSITMETDFKTLLLTMLPEKARIWLRMTPVMCRQLQKLGRDVFGREFQLPTDCTNDQPVFLQAWYILSNTPQEAVSQGSLMHHDHPLTTAIRVVIRRKEMNVYGEYKFINKQDDNITFFTRIYDDEGKDMVFYECPDDALRCEYVYERKRGQDDGDSMQIDEPNTYIYFKP